MQVTISDDGLSVYVDGVCYIFGNKEEAKAFANCVEKSKDADGCARIHKPEKTIRPEPSHEQEDDLDDGPDFPRPGM